MSDDPVIIPKEDGPLIVRNPPNLTGPDGAEIETKAVAPLCRCGQSANKPFCDGTHREIGFTGAKSGKKLRNAAIDYSGEVEGQKVTISYTPVLCTHAAECQARARDVFNPRESPWIQPEKGTLTDILSVIAACPSGALRVSTSEAEPGHMTTDEVAIRVEKNGPLHVTNIPLEAEFNGVGASEKKYSLCRCGLSNNKPFCDGSHHDAKWRDT